MAAAMAALLSACTVGPDYVRPEQPVPVDFRASSNERQVLARPKSRWWTQFGSAELNALVEDALASNHDVRAAKQRIAQAEAKAGIEAGALLPTVQGSSKMETGKKSSNSFAQSATVVQQLYQASIEVSYEIDLWGKNRSAMSAALATAQSSVFERETVVVTLVADVVGTYFQYLQSCERAVVAKRNIENMKRVLSKVEHRQRIGEGSELEVYQQATALHNAEAILPVIELTREQQLNRLAYLVGKSATELKLEGRSLDDVMIPEVSEGLPSELLLTRPDIRRAEANLVAANANINLARAKMFPSFTLTGERGWASSDLHNLISPGSIIWTLAGKLAQTIFDNGKSNSEIAYYEARWNELVELYRQSIIASLRDVEDSLANIRYSKERDEAQGLMVGSARKAFTLSQGAFSIGIVDYLTVLETERTQYNAEDIKIQTRYGRLSAAVGLFKALGGSIEPEKEELRTNPDGTAAPIPAGGAVPGPGDFQNQSSGLRAYYDIHS
ncbi:hypothetical protein A6A04_13840 [Paramagnetospirillum marisnigri]|uniref:Transporter n=2 Tax=Paramagnetospirillum marisnigri TaxID=1285242 RepID=A0A178MWI5_9PROT|nr:hypothetical protein A6A04_13840 [Paramagnetospirillum marisnigri]